MVQSSNARELIERHGSPLYVYDGAWLRQRAEVLLAITKGMDSVVRYAVKANPHPEIVHLFDRVGLHFDASSEFEAAKLIRQGIDPGKISLSSQQPPHDMGKALHSGVHFVATSLHQLDLVRESGWQGNLAVRINPGVGSGHTKRTTTGGVSASFGTWHEYLPDILAWQLASGCEIDRLHVHVGAGVDPAVWRQVMRRALTIAEQLPTVKTLDIGGGFKVARLPEEQETDIQAVFRAFRQELDTFAEITGRRLKLEVEPGTWLVANSGTLLSTIVDLVDTGAKGYKFIKLDTGMNDILRPTLYGAQHPIIILNKTLQQEDYVVVGHNCESGDILTPAPGQPEVLATRTLNKASIGDIVAIGGVGAYCASMAADGYNSFPPAKEIIIAHER